MLVMDTRWFLAPLWLLCGLLAAGSGLADPPASQDAAGTLGELQSGLGLTDAQTLKCAELLKAFDSQARLDRENLKGDIGALVEAYHRRTALIDQNLRSILAEGQ